jgi:transcription elongation factor SPT5
MDRQDDAERREAASAGLLSLMHAGPPATGPTNNVLDAKAAAPDAREIAARLDERARRQTTFMYEERDTGDILTQVALGPMVHDDPMWRVRVRVSRDKVYAHSLTNLLMAQHGHKVDIVFKLLQQRIDKEQARINDKTFRVVSATFQPCIPGSIYVEAPSALHVRLACGGLHGTMGSIELVSLDDAVAVLTCGVGPQVLDPHSWVRIRRGLYTGDLAFVRSVVDHVPDGEDDEDVFPSTIATINLVPRIPLGIKIHKRKRQTISDRALPVLFNSRRYETECQRIKWDEDGRAQEDMWKFRCAIYRNGLLEMRVVMSTLNFKKVNPTREELEKWVESSDQDVVLAAKNALVASRSENYASGLWVGDRVEIKQGWAHTKKGKVQSIEGDVVYITSSSSPPISVRISEVQKYFVVGDNVWALSGPEVGLEGWCIKVKDGIVQVSEHGTHREVSSLYPIGYSVLKISPTSLVLGRTGTPSAVAACD